MGISPEAHHLDMFDEIDYGVDENQTEDKVINRIGQKAIDDWNNHAIVPTGWSVDVGAIIQNWQNFAQDIMQDQDIVQNEHNEARKTILVVTSNGVARFAPHITGDFDGFKENHPLKLRTGAYGILTYTPDHKWIVKEWDRRPS